MSRVFLRHALALVSGAALPFAFAPFDLPYLAMVALAGLFFSWRHASPTEAALSGYLFGLAQYGVGISWVYVSMHRYGGASIFEAIGLTALLVMFLALYPALAGFLAVRSNPRLLAGSQVKTIYFALIWVLVEWFRGWFLTGFPWLQIGNSQIDTPIGQALAPVSGVHGVGLMVSLLAALTVGLLDRNFQRRKTALILISAILLLCLTLSRTDWTEPGSSPFQASLLQGNIPQNQKWEPAFQSATLEKYSEITRQHWDSRLIVWPETAVPAFYHQVKERWIAQLQADAEQHGVDLLFGIPVSNEQGDNYFNALIALGQQPGMYFKRHLVPFGEFLPLRPVLGFVLEILEIPLSDFSAGSDQQEPLRAAGYPLAASICYEDAFGNEGRMNLPEAAYLVNVTNDAWFGDSIAPHQHFQMARMRSLESGRDMLRVTNTGITAGIDHRGKVIKQAPLFQQAVVTLQVTPRIGATPYVRFGDWPVLALIAIAAGILRFRANRGVEQT